MVYYYKNKLPLIDDIVIGKVENIDAFGVKISLIEYNNIQGFINCSDVSRKKKVNLNKLLTVGKDILLHVIQIDTVNQYIDLSKRTISDEDIKLFSEKHKLHIQLYGLFRYLYTKLFNYDSIDKINKIDNDDLYQFMCGTLFEIQTEFENDYILENLLNKDTNNEIIEFIDFDSIKITNDEFKKVLNNYIDNKINRIKPEIIETIKLMTYSATGLADIKNTLDFKNFTEYTDLSKDFDIKINYISDSAYSIIITQKNFDLFGSIEINDAILIIKKEIKKRAIETQIQNQIML